MKDEEIKIVQGWRGGERGRGGEREVSMAVFYYC